MSEYPCSKSECLNGERGGAPPSLLRCLVHLQHPQLPKTKSVGSESCDTRWPTWVPLPYISPPSPLSISSVSPLSPPSLLSLSCLSCLSRATGLEHVSPHSSPIAIYWARQPSASPAVEMQTSVLDFLLSANITTGDLFECQHQYRRSVSWLIPRAVPTPF